MSEQVKQTQNTDKDRRIETQNERKGEKTQRTELNKTELCVCLFVCNETKRIGKSLDAYTARRLWKLSAANEENSFPRFTKNHLARHNTHAHRIGKIYFLNAFFLAFFSNSFVYWKQNTSNQKTENRNNKQNSDMMFPNALFRQFDRKGSTILIIPNNNIKHTTRILTD